MTPNQETELYQATKAIKELDARLTQAEGTNDGLQIKLNETQKELARVSAQLNTVTKVLDKSLALADQDAKKLYDLLFRFEMLSLWAMITEPMIADLSLKAGLMTQEQYDQAARMRAETNQKILASQQPKAVQPKGTGLSPAEEEALLALLKNLGGKKGL